MKRYVLGFVFDAGYHHVLLIQKARPEWQRGKLNGVGGQIEVGETPLQAMSRELREEAKLDVDLGVFGRLIVRSEGQMITAEVWMFWGQVEAFLPGLAGRVTNGETLIVVPLRDLGAREATLLPLTFISDLHYLVPMAVNCALGNGAPFFEISEMSCSPELVDHLQNQEAWECGGCRIMISTKFCPDCGMRRPRPEPPMTDEEREVALKMSNAWCSKISEHHGDPDAHHPSLDALGRADVHAWLEVARLAIAMRESR